MTRTALAVPAGPGQPAAPLGVFGALGMGWRLVMSDFWNLWLVAIVQMLILMGAQYVIGIVAVILVLPPLAAGMFYVVSRRMDGQTAGVGDLFKGFQDRFSQSVMGFLPVAGASLVFGMLLGLIIVAAMLAGALAAAAAGRDEGLAIVLVVLDIVAALSVTAVLLLIVKVFSLFFLFVFPAVWSHPESGWAAAKESMRLVKEHIGSVIGLVLLLWILGDVATMVGFLACCIGLLLTAPLMVIWHVATVTYLYRSWTGRPLTQGA